MKTGNNGTRLRGNDPMVLLRNDIASLKEDLTSLAAGQIDAANDRAKQVVKRMGKSGKKFIDRGRKRALAVHRKLGDAAAAHPVRTVVVAALVGAVGIKVLGWMWRR